MTWVPVELLKSDGEGSHRAKTPAWPLGQFDEGIAVTLQSVSFPLHNLLFSFCVSSPEKNEHFGLEQPSGYWLCCEPEPSADHVKIRFSSFPDCFLHQEIGWLTWAAHRSVSEAVSGDHSFYTRDSK